MEIILGKYGELALKGLNRNKFETSLLRTIRKRIADCGDFRVTVAQSALYVEPLDENCDVNRAFERVRKVFGLKPAEIIKQLDLLRPIYSKTNQYGHFGRKAGDKDFELFSWEQTDKAAELLKAVAK